MRGFPVVRRLLPLFLLLGSAGIARADDPPAPSGAHPRLFLNSKTLPALIQNAMTKGTSAANYVGGCPMTTTLTMRGGADASTWPSASLQCAFAYLTAQDATMKQTYLSQAIKYWIAAMEDDQTLGDKKGCLADSPANWKTWDGSGATPPIILTVTHDTGYPIRWYGPFVALVYDWLHDAPGVDEALRAHTRLCLQNWIDYYTVKGYHHDEAGSNYNAGYVAGKTFAAIAMAGEGGADSDRLWTETINEVFKGLLIGKGLAGAAAGVGAPAGAMLGGDWGEGWQYGPLSILEYAMAARAMEEAGVPLPEMDAWTNSLIVRYMQATVPHKEGHYVGGDFDNGERMYAFPNAGIVDAVLVGPSSEAAAGWAKSMAVTQKLTGVKTPFLGDVLAEARSVTAQDYATQTPPPPLWYLARGTRILYVRTAWSDDAFWGAFTSSPQINADHHHFDASSFVFTRGADHLIVDPSGYGCRSTLPTNAVTADSSVASGKYAPSQTPWSQAELVWARATEPAVYAARADFAKAFNFPSKPSDVSYAHREWAFLPEGEIVTIDRVHTSDASRGMYVNLHTNTAGKLAMDGVVATAAVGGSVLAIHPVMLSGGAPAITKPMLGGDCYDGTCSNVRIPVDNYGVKVPGPFATAVHVIDGLATGEQRATVGSLNDMTYDPAHTNTGVIGAAVYRGSKQSYVVASSAMDGQAGAMLAYSVPGGSSARHIVFDAPEDDDGKSMVVAAVDGDRCSVTLTAGAGFVGRPLMFQVSSVADGCKATEDTNVAAGTAPPGGGAETTVGPGGMPNPGSGGAGPSTGTGGNGVTSLSGGCGCAVASSAASGLSIAFAALAMLLRRRRRD